jgi:YebC/PmpR family DNA-binding regulatory protein
LTDNRNRTASVVRHIFSKYGGSLGETGSVAWQFETVGQIVVATDGHDPEEIALAAIDAGARDFEVEDDSVIITTDPDQLSDVAEKLEAAGYQIRQADIQRIPTTTVELEGGQAQSALKLLEALEDLDDVQEVYTNASFPAEVRSAV